MRMPRMEVSIDLTYDQFCGILEAGLKATDIIREYPGNVHVETGNMITTGDPAIKVKIIFTPIG